jgi:hypothetical protein
MCQVRSVRESSASIIGARDRKAGTRPIVASAWGSPASIIGTAATCRPAPLFFRRPNTAGPLVASADRPARHDIRVPPRLAAADRSLSVRGRLSESGDSHPPIGRRCRGRRACGEVTVAIARQDTVVSCGFRPGRPGSAGTCRPACAGLVPGSRGRFGGCLRRRAAWRLPPHVLSSTSATVSCGESETPKRSHRHETKSIVATPAHVDVIDRATGIRRSLPQRRCRACDGVAKGERRLGDSWPDYAVRRLKVGKVCHRVNRQYGRRNLP